MDTRNKLATIKTAMIQLKGDPVANDLIQNLKATFDNRGLSCHFIEHGFDSGDAYARNQLLCVCAGMPIDDQFNFSGHDDYPMVKPENSLNMLCVIVNAASLLKVNNNLSNQVCQLFHCEPHYQKSVMISQLIALNTWLFDTVGSERLQLFVVGKERLTARQHKMIDEFTKTLHMSLTDIVYIDTHQATVSDQPPSFTEETLHQLERFFANHASWNHPSFIDSILCNTLTTSKTM